MDSNPTLHDFVLHLITNQDARLAFQLDPQGTLRFEQAQPPERPSKS